MNNDKIRQYGETLMLWTLCVVSISATIYIYMYTVINFWTILGAVISALVILFADFARKKKMGGLLYTAVFICVNFVPSFAIKGITELSEFIRWFFSGSEAVETRTSFIFVLTVMASFMFTSAAYYFTKVIYRTSLITLITLIPFALSVKTVTAMPSGYAAIASAANIILFIYYSRRNITNGAIPKGRSTFVVYTDYAVAVIMLALLIPKPATAPYYKKFEEFTNRFQFGGTSESTYVGKYKHESGGTDELRRGESVLLYTVNTPSPVYMKTQVFDIYDSENGVWVEADELSGSRHWQDTASLLSYEKLGAAAETLMSDSDFVRKYKLTETESYAAIYAHDFPAAYILSPLRATELVLSNVNADRSVRTIQGEIFTNNKLMPANANYTIRFYTEDIFDKLISNGACDITAEEFGLELAELFILSEKGTAEYDVTSQFYIANNYAMEYAEQTVTEVSPEIQALADEIVAGLEYDYQKAGAIEQYFRTNGFKYDLFYEPPEEKDTPEYFLFESKKGICSDYATAYTLLARASGLTVRYVEGFVMQSSETTPNMYFIYTDNAHAYPEVYIPGAGWRVYEPTPAGVAAAGNNDRRNDRTDPLAILFTAVIAVAVIGVFILVILFTPKILELIFRLRVKLSEGSRAVIMLYNRHASNMERKFEISCKPFTPEQLSAYTEEKTSLSLDPIIKPFVNACYGGMTIEDKDKSDAYECYKAQYKAIKKTKIRKD